MNYDEFIIVYPCLSLEKWDDEGLFSLIPGLDFPSKSDRISHGVPVDFGQVFAEAGDPLLMALFQGDGDGARRLPRRRSLSLETRRREFDWYWN